MNTKVLFHSTLGTLFAVTAFSGLMRCAQDNGDNRSVKSSSNNEGDGLDPNRKVLYEEYHSSDSSEQDLDLELTGSPTPAPSATPTINPTASPSGSPDPEAIRRENASMLIRIVKPYCRNADFWDLASAADAKATQIESYCVGTVISNGTRPFVITAAHCFATECPAGSKVTVKGVSTAINGASDSIPMGNIQITSSPTKVMTGYNWADSSKVLTAKNVKILSGFTGQLQRGYKYELMDLWTNTKFVVNPLYITRDIAIIDFGPQLAQNTITGTGYPSLQFDSTPNALGSSTMDYATTNRANGTYVLGYNNYNSTHYSCWNVPNDPTTTCKANGTASTGSTPNVFESTKLERTLENINDISPQTDIGGNNIVGTSFNSAFTNSFVTSGNATLGNSNSFANFTVSRNTFGDSGASFQFNSTVIGIASAVQFDTSGSSYYGTGFPSGFNSRPIHPIVSYSSIDKDMVGTAINSLISATSSASSVTLGVDLWNVAPIANWTPGDNTPVPTGAAHAKRFLSTFVNPHTVTTNTSTVPWAKVPVTTGSKTYVKSYTPNGVLDGIPAIGSGTRTAVWVANGLTQGYYDVSMLYPMNSGNAKCIQVLRRTNSDSAYTVGTSTNFPIFKTLNQQIGDAAKTVTTTFNNTSTSLTPVTASPVVNSKTFVWVSNNAQNAANSGVLGIKITDSGCGTSAAPAGRMVGDTISLTIKSQTK